MNDADFIRYMVQNPRYIRRAENIAHEFERLQAENADLREELAVLRRAATISAGPHCSHCGQPDCMPHVEGCPERTLDAMQDDCPSAFETGAKWANALMGIDHAPGKDHTVLAVIEDGKLIATGPCCGGKCSDPGPMGFQSHGSLTELTDRLLSKPLQLPQSPADSYCPACGGWGDHRIGCPNK